MVVPVIGSMAVKGIFKGGGLLSGLSSTSGKLKEVQQRSKSTTTEMKRMNQGANQLKKTLAMIGVGGFSALLLSAPQLAGSLAKIKNNMMLIAWSIGKHLKPALEAVNTILTGIRTGDWETVKKGIVDLTSSVWDLVAAGTAFVIDVVFGEGAAKQVEDDFTRWGNKLMTAWAEGDVFSLMHAAIQPVIWSLERLWDTGIKIGNWLKTEAGQFAVGKGLIAAMPGGEAAIAAGGFITRALGGAPAVSTDKGGFGGGYQTGGFVPRTGMYKLHAGETVTMAGSTPSGGSSSSILVDFSGANINLSDGIQLDQFANAISMKIAEKQQSLSY